MSLTPEKGAQIVAGFDYSTEQLHAAVARFQELASIGLEHDGEAMTMIPTYVTDVPDGSEKGTYLALDLGGTNLRVCSVTLDGDGTFSNRQCKYPVSKQLQVSDNWEDLFGFIAKKVGDFVEEHHSDAFEHTHVGNFLRLGFTFSFPVTQTAIDNGVLLRWTKGFHIASAVGKDVVSLLQTKLDEDGIPVKVAALVNDTVGTMMARSYGSGLKGGAAMGAIFGTGTNGAYMEKIENIKKLPTMPSNIKHMIINTEWGSFDNDLRVLPQTIYDIALDEITPNPGIQMFEKRISGMFLGEILRQILVVHYHNIKLAEAWSLDTALMSDICNDPTPDLARVGIILRQELAIDDSADNRRILRDITFAIGRRAARLSAIPIAALALSTGHSRSGLHYDIGVDGSVVEFYPGFETMLREALREILGTESESRIHIGIAKDGSGVGAALVALTTVMQETRESRMQ